jgi:hypothetical protein
MVMSAENMVSMVRISAKATDIERIYEALDEPMPEIMKVAMYLVH